MKKGSALLEMNNCMDVDQHINITDALEDIDN